MRYNEWPTFAAHGHATYKCACGTIIASCRCMDANKPIIEAVCTACANNPKRTKKIDQNSSCCSNESRTTNGWCQNCGDPCF